MKLRWWKTEKEIIKENTEIAIAIAKNNILIHQMQLQLSICELECWAAEQQAKSKALEDIMDFLTCKYQASSK